MSGTTAKPNVVWLMERRKKQEDVILVECTSYMMEEETVVEDLKDLYSFQTVELGPDDFGVPMSRPRKIIIGLLRRCGVFKYSIRDPQHGITIFFKVLCLTGDDMFLAPKEVIEEETVRKAKAMKVPLEWARGGDVGELLAAGNAARRLDYKRKLEEEEKSKDRSVCVSQSFMSSCFSTQLVCTCHSVLFSRTSCLCVISSY